MKNSKDHYRRLDQAFNFIVKRMLKHGLKGHYYCAHVPGGIRNYIMLEINASNEAKIEKIIAP